MRSSKLWSIGLSVFAAAMLVSQSSARAAVLSLGASGWVAEYDSSDIQLTLVPGATGSVVHLIKDATFSSVNQLGGINSLPITFVAPSNPSPLTIEIDSETITNDTGKDWYGFRFGLLNNATFDTAASAGFGDTSVSDTFMKAQFTSAAQANDTYTDFDGIVAHQPLGFNVWTPGLAGTTHLVMDATGTFTLKEQPLVPLPAAAWTGLSGLVGLVVVRGARGSSATRPEKG